jgi:hypothetical protein
MEQNSERTEHSETNIGRGSDRTRQKRAMFLRPAFHH